jgi:hypothetical protein
MILYNLCSLGSIFGPKKQEVTGGLYDELYNLYSSPIIITVIKSRRVRWVGDVARME